MNETELKDAFRRTIAAGPPVRLDAAGMIRLGHRARIGRRIALVAGASAVTVGVVAGAVALLQVGGPGGPSHTAAGPSDCSWATTAVELPVSPSPAGAAVPASLAPPACPTPSTNTETPWPSGQSDRTAHSGPHEQRAQQVLALLTQSLPAGFRASSPWHQAQFDHWEGRTEVWEYTANLVATNAAGRSGVLLARVLTASSQSSADLCHLAGYFYGPPATGCRVVTVNGKQVATARHPAQERNQGYSPSLDQWAVYRYADGTAVWIAQAKVADGHGPGLAAPMFTEQQLARLATNPAFAV